MSCEGRKEPFFEDPSEAKSGVSPTPNIEPTFSPRFEDPFILKEEQTAGAAAIFLRCGIVIAFALGAFGGYQYLHGSSVSHQLADGSRTDWAGRPLATNEDGKLVWSKEEGANPSNIDPMQTASIDAKPEPSIIEAKPTPIDSNFGPNAQFHIVKSGDTLSAIAKRYSVKTAHIIALNNIENPRKIKPGMKLFVTR